jgi:two-component system chemotaxis response regulator CheY
MTRTVLVVDDSVSLRQVLAIALRGGGYDVLEAGDGAAALELLDGRTIDLVISDVNLPRMDGIAFLRALKGKTDYRFTPVIMLTTETQQARKDEGRAAGARAWVAKPFQPAQLLDAVARLVRP